MSNAFIPFLLPHYEEIYYIDSRHFKENLLKKIEINRLTTRVSRSIGPPGSGQKVDKEAMRRLLDIGGYTHRRVREMDFYLLDADDDRVVGVLLAAYLVDPPGPGGGRLAATELGHRPRTADRRGQGAGRQRRDRSQIRVFRPGLG